MQIVHHPRLLLNYEPKSYMIPCYVLPHAQLMHHTGSPTGGSVGATSLVVRSIRGGLFFCDTNGVKAIIA